MDLTGESFRQIVAQLKAASGTTELRKAPRVGVRNRTLLTPLKHSANAGAEKPKTVSVSVRDISVEGIGVLTNQPLEAGSLFAIQMPLKDGNELVAVYSVRHCCAVESTLFKIGGLLVKLTQTGEEQADKDKPAAKAGGKPDAKDKAGAKPAAADKSKPGEAPKPGAAPKPAVAAKTGEAAKPGDKSKPVATTVKPKETAAEAPKPAAPVTAENAPATQAAKPDEKAAEAA